MESGLEVVETQKSNSMKKTFLRLRTVARIWTPLKWYNMARPHETPVGLGTAWAVSKIIWP